MKRFIDVHTGEVMAGSGEVVLKSDTQSACLVVLAYDSARKIGGLAHAMFLANGLDKKLHISAVQEASRAIDEMIKDMTFLGAAREDIEVYLVAGENVEHQRGDPDYNRNIALTINLLREKHIKFREDTPTDLGNQHVSLDVESGRILYT